MRLEGELIRRNKGHLSRFWCSLNLLDSLTVAATLNKLIKLMLFSYSQ